MLRIFIRIDLARWHRFLKERFRKYSFNFHQIPTLIWFFHWRNPNFRTTLIKRKIWKISVFVLHLKSPSDRMKTFTVMNCFNCLPSCSHCCCNGQIFTKHTALHHINVAQCSISFTSTTLNTNVIASTLVRKSQVSSWGVTSQLLNF